MGASDDPGFKPPDGGHPELFSSGAGMMTAPGSVGAESAFAALKGTTKTDAVIIPPGASYVNAVHSPVGPSDTLMPSQQSAYAAPNGEDFTHWGDVGHSGAGQGGVVTPGHPGAWPDSGAGSPS